MLYRFISFLRLLIFRSLWRLSRSHPQRRWAWKYFGPRLKPLPPSVLPTGSSLQEPLSPRNLRAEVEALPDIRTVVDDYIVLYRDAEQLPADLPQGFRCKADDTEHAEEQFHNAYPNGDLLWIWWGDDFNDALDDYYGMTNFNH